MATLDGLFDEAVHHHQNGRLHDAETLYRRILQADPNHAAAHYLLGLVAFQLGQPDSAVALIRRALALSPGDADWYFNLGMVLVQQGRGREAIASFRQAVHLNPRHTQAQNNLGNALVAEGSLDHAVACYRAALRIDPGSAITHFNLGSALQGLGRFAEAAASLRDVLALDPKDAHARFVLGVVCQALGQTGEAVDCFRQVIAVNSNMAEAHWRLGNLLHERGDLDAAEAGFRQALQLAPGHVGALNNLGVTLKKQGRLAEARACYDQTLRIEPHQVDACNNLGTLLMEEGRFAEASACLRQGLGRNPDHADLHSNLGIALHQQRMLADARASFYQALKINPQHADAHNNLGNLLEEQGEMDQALASYRQALRLNPRLASAHHNLCIVLMRLGQVQEALEENAHTLRLDPGHRLALWQRALLNLLRGNYEAGWKDFEQRWALPNASFRSFQEPRWDGTLLEGKTILVFAEGGLGDTLQFARYLPLIKERDGRVLFACQSRLLQLGATLAGVDQLVATGSPLPRFDVQVPLLSLPGIFATTPATIPARVPYLAADPSLVARWRNELAPLPGLRVGIVWQGDPNSKGDRYRSIPLKLFEPLARVAGVSLVSLQVGPGTEQLPQAGFAVTDLGSRFDTNSLSDMAAVLMSLDLVVTIDSAPAHLAGALGVPVWIVLPTAVDWRWFLDRPDSPWYPSARLFRQSRPGEWSGVLKQVAEELRVGLAAR